jgi:hypothetical protein
VSACGAVAGRLCRTTLLLLLLPATSPCHLLHHPLYLPTRLALPPGFDTYNTINLRLFRAAPAREFDLQSFNTGDYMRAVEQRQRAGAL